MVAEPTTFVHGMLILRASLCCSEWELPESCSCSFTDRPAVWTPRCCRHRLWLFSSVCGTSVQCCTAFAIWSAAPAVLWPIGLHAACLSSPFLACLSDSRPMFRVLLVCSHSWLSGSNNQLGWLGPDNLLVLPAVCILEARCAYRECCHTCRWVSQSGLRIPAQQQ